MAWDVTHSRSLYEMLTAGGPFQRHLPIPHFLTFDKGFVRLSEFLRPRGIIFSQNTRYDCIYSKTIIQPVTILMGNICKEFYDARDERKKRCEANKHKESEMLQALELKLQTELNAFVSSVSK